MATLKRIPKKYSPRTTSFIDPFTGDMRTHTMEHLHIPVNKKTGMCLLSDCLAACASNRLVLVCGDTSTPREWFDDTRKANWRKHGVFANRSYTFKRDDTSIDVRIIGDFFPGLTGVETAQISYNALNALLIKFCDMPLLTSASQTGLALIERTLPANITLPTLDDDVDTIIRSNTTQPRQHVVTHAGVDTIPSFYYVDGRWMYAACVSGMLPLGKGTRDNVATYEKYIPGWYNVTFTIPDNWSHVGLAPIKSSPDDSISWYWPNTPNTTYTTWLAEPELRLLDENNWRYTIHERIMFSHARYLRLWHDKLVKMWDYADTINDPIIKKHLQHGVRAIMLKAIGRLYSKSWKREQEYPLKEWANIVSTLSVEARLSAYRSNDGKTMIVPLVDTVNVHDDKDGRFYQPHIPSHIWSYCRMLVTKSMLQLPYDDIVGVNLDAIYTSSLPALPDDGHTPGYFRLKGKIEHPVNAPTSRSDLTQLRLLSEDQFTN